MHIIDLVAIALTGGLSRKHFEMFFLFFPRK